LETTAGISREQAIGKTPLETGMVIAGEEGEMEARFRLFLDSRKPLQDYDQALCLPDGRTLLLSLSSAELTLNEEPCLIVVAKNVTELRQAEETRQQLSQASRLALLGEMTASIAHELNQPLGAILSNTDAAEMLLEQPHPPLDELRLILADIRRDDLRASAVIEKVRALVGARSIHREALDVNELLSETLVLLKHDANRRGVTLLLEPAPQLPRIEADAMQIQQLLINLIVNGMDAMQQTPLASRQLVVRSSLKNGSEIMVSVEDRGHGIPSEKLSRVFESFYTSKEEGMGLGLALAQSIAEAHGGYLMAENNPATGATFYCILPFEPPSNR
ncbi:MAG: ATP-binding protein, partial [Terrimicrobiaceae bacterium]